VVCGVDQVDDVDHPEAGVQQRDVVVRDGAPALLNEDGAVTQVSRRLPYPCHDFGSALEGMGLVRKSEIAVANHVPDNSEQRLVGRIREMGGEVFGPDENVYLRRSEFAVVLSVHKQEIDSNSRRLLLEDVTQRDEKTDTRGTIVRAWYGHLPLGFGGGGF
jgi:hypothetical protein